MFRNRPLFATRADQPLFVWTDPAAAARVAVKHDENTLITGERGSGKTSLLHGIEHFLRESGQPVAFVSLSGVLDIDVAAAAIIDATRDQGWLPARTLGATSPADPFTTTAAIRELVSAPDRSVLLLDDVASELGLILFGRLRDELWQLPPIWVVAADATDAAGFLEPPADAFFEAVVYLDTLSLEERMELLMHRNSDLPEAAVNELALSGPANTRDFIAYARQVVEHGKDPQEIVRRENERLARAEDAAGRDGAMLVTVLATLAPVSASDERLLHELGWPRPRATDVMRRLEHAGVLRSFSERRGGSAGRPRKLYDFAT